GRAGRAARIIVKMNALVDPQAIEALYRASCAGVKIDLIVRGVCCLRPGVPGVSENICVRSIVGRFLEHSRVFYFENGGAPDMFCASADWMERNFLRRVDVAFPVRRERHAERILRDLDFCLQDNCQAWKLQPDGCYVRIGRGGERVVRTQAGGLKTQQRLALVDPEGETAETCEQEQRRQAPQGGALRRLTGAVLRQSSHVLHTNDR